MEKKQPGFVKCEINENKDRSLTNIVYRETKEAAKLAEKEMVNIPKAQEWYVCYKEGSIISKSLITIAEF